MVWLLCDCGVVLPFLLRCLCWWCCCLLDVVENARVTILRLKHVVVAVVVAIAVAVGVLTVPLVGLE